MNLETVAIESLELDPNNARKHSKRNLDAIAASLNKFGQRKPIVVHNGTVIAGNGTLEAAKSLGWKEIGITRCPDDWDADTAKAYALADNRSSELAEWDDLVLANQLLDLDGVGWDIEALGFEPLPLRDLDESKEDEIPEPPVEPVTKLGDMWQIGSHRILCGDSLDNASYDRLLDGKIAEIIFTDPPYGVSVVKDNMVGANFGVAKKGNYSAVIGDESGHTAKDALELLLAKYPKAVQIWWGANHYAQTANIPNSSCWLIWDKRAETGIVNTFADAELAWTNMTSPVRIHRQLWNGMIRSGEHDKRVHPTQKPVALAEWAFGLADKNQEKKIIVDAFTGSGSTLVAAARTGRIGLGIELDPKYVDVIVARLEKETGLQAELIP